LEADVLEVLMLVSSSANGPFRPILNKSSFFAQSDVTSRMHLLNCIYLTNFASSSPAGLLLTG
jgi:hypothetical protein